MLAVSDPVDKRRFICDNVCISLVYAEGFACMSARPDYDQLYEIAESQAGYFTAAQARKVGFSWERLSSNTEVGRFQRVSHGIYRLAHFPSSPFEDLFVAWLRTGPHSVISHESALSVYELSDAIPGRVHVIVPRTASRRRPDISLHTNRLESDEITTREGLRITSVERTIADVWLSGLAEEQVRLAIEEALQRGLTSEAALRFQAERRGGKVARLIHHVIEELKGEIQ